MTGRKLTLVFALFALFSLTGTDCLFVARSGSSSTSNGDETTGGGLLVVIRNGRFVDAPVEGLGYRSGSVAGVTGANGEFRYQDGAEVVFFIGDIALGAAPGKALVTPLDLVPGGTLDSAAVINIARLLQSLDAVPGDARISIPASVRAAAVSGNAGVSAAIQYLDFADDERFVNAAAQLVATLTARYPFTGVLVDGQSARAHLQQTLAGTGVRAAGGEPAQ